MRKIIGGLGLCVIVLLVVGVFVAASDSEIVDSITENSEVAQEVKGYVEDFVEKRGIKKEDINTVREVDFDSLPKEVNIENVGDTNLAIYEIDYDESSGEEKKVFVVTYSVEELKAQGDLIIAHDKRQFLNFGFSGEMAKSGFLETATGVEGSLEKGYVMMREGSITGMSTSLEVSAEAPKEGVPSSEGKGEIDIIIYKNGEQVGFGNTLNADLGMRKDYDVQSNGVVTFEPGDAISVYVDAGDGLIWRDVITMMEITTTD